MVSWIGKNFTVTVNDKMFKFHKQTKKPYIDKLCPSQRNFPPHSNLPKKYFPGGEIVFLSI